jgi:hypothetical protein
MDDEPDLAVGPFHFPDGKSGVAWRLSVPTECIRTPVHEERAPYRT